MAINPELTRLRRIIDRLLRDRRPDRYKVNEESDTEDVDVEDVGATHWLDDVAAEVAPLIPEEYVRQLYARTLVGQREGAATRKANGLLRDTHRTGQLVLGWWDVKDHPIAVIERLITRGERVKIVEERVAIRAAKSDDFRKFATEERRKASVDFTARNDACLGAEWTADEMDAAGASSWLIWAEQVCPPPPPEDD